LTCFQHTAQLRQKLAVGRCNRCRIEERDPVAVLESHAHFEVTFDCTPHRVTANQAQQLTA